MELKYVVVAKKNVILLIWFQQDLFHKKSGGGREMDSMVIRVVEFSSGVYKIRKIFA